MYFVAKSLLQNFLCFIQSSIFCAYVSTLDPTFAVPSARSTSSLWPTSGFHSRHLTLVCSTSLSMGCPYEIFNTALSIIGFSTSFALAARWPLSLGKSSVRTVSNISQTLTSAIFCFWSIILIWWNCLREKCHSTSPSNIMTSTRVGAAARGRSWIALSSFWIQKKQLADHPMSVVILHCLEGSQLPELGTNI